MQLELIDWIDAHGSDGWHSMKRIEEFCYGLPCRTVGWVVAENEEALTLTSSYSTSKSATSPDSGSGYFTVPKKMITKRTVLRKR
jgi:hypothetical protein